MSGTPFETLDALSQDLMISVRHSRPGLVVAQVQGDLDLTTNAVLAWCLHAVLQRRPQQLVIDLSMVDFLGARGLDTLLEVRSTGMNAGLHVQFVGRENVSVARLFLLAGVTGLLRHALSEIDPAQGAF